MGAYKMHVWTHMALIGLVLLFAIYESICVLMWPEAGAFHKLVAVLAFVAAIFFLVRRDTWLPFLGPTALPASLIPDSKAPQDSNLEISLPFPTLPDGTRILYWGAQESKGVSPNPWDAYGKYPNAGVTVAKDGKATFHLFCPGRYMVPMGGTLKRHIHFRVVRSNGMLGPVRTSYVEC